MTRTRSLVFLAGLLLATAAQAQTYTPNKGLAEPVVGGSANAWGTLLNSNAGLLDSALGGTASVSVAGNVDVTATAAQAQNLVQRRTGALTGNINYILPAAGSLYVIDNQTSGSYTVTVKTTAGGSTGTAVPQGTALLVYSDATNVYPATRSRANAITAPSATISGAVSAGSVSASGAVSGGSLSVSGTATVGSLSAGSGTISTNNVVQGGAITSLGGYNLSEAAVTAAGATQGTATALTATLNMVTGAGGVILSTNYAFEPVIIQNQTNVSINVYPASGGTMAYNGTWGATNAAMPLAGYTTAVCFGIGGPSFACR